MLIPLTNQTPGRWAGGTIQTIYLHPTEADLSTGDYLFWINTATIEQEAAYSHFPGYHRFHLILSSPGLQLHFSQPEQVVELGQFDSYLFDGGRPLRAEPIGGPVTAFNIIMKTGLTATVQQIAFSPESLLLIDLLDDADQTETAFYLLYGVTSQIKITTDVVMILNPGDAFLILPKNRSNLRASSDKAFGLLAKIILPAKT